MSLIGPISQLQRKEDTHMSQKYVVRSWMCDHDSIYNYLTLKGFEVDLTSITAQDKTITLYCANLSPEDILSFSNDFDIMIQTPPTEKELADKNKRKQLTHVVHAIIYFDIKGARFRVR
jgi:hypothetical protein